MLGKRGISADTALRLGRLLETSPQLWMRLQADWDLHKAMKREARAASQTDGLRISVSRCSSCRGGTVNFAT